MGFKISDEGLKELLILSKRLTRACEDEDYRKKLMRNPEKAIPFSTFAKSKRS